MAAFPSASGSNRKGIDAAIDLIEKAILDMEHRIISNKKQDEENIPKINPSAKRKTKTDPAKRKLKRSAEVAVLLKRPNKVAKKTSQIKRRNVAVQKFQKENLTPLQEEKSNQSNEYYKNDKIKNPSKAQKCPTYKSSEINKENVENYRFTKPTLCSKYKVELQSTSHLRKTNHKIKLPYVASASQGTSHNLGTIIQQNLGHLKLNPANDEGRSRYPEITEDHIKEAVANLEKEIKTTLKVKEKKKLNLIEIIKQ